VDVEPVNPLPLNTAPRKAIVIRCKTVRFNIVYNVEFSLVGLSLFMSKFCITVCSGYQDYDAGDWCNDVFVRPKWQMYVTALHETLPGKHLQASLLPE